MVGAAYEKLIGALNARSTALPAVKCDEFFALVQELFTPDEAAIASAMPLGFSTVEDIAENLPTKDLKKLSGQLETMGDKGLIHIKQDSGGKLYEFLPFVPGLLEFQLMKGIVDERHKKIAYLLRDYSKALKNMVISATLPIIEKAAPARKVPVEREITHLSTIIPYQEMKQLIMDTEYVSAGTCICRHQGALMDKPCKKPVNNCMILGDTAKFAAERGFANRLSKDEAIQRLDEAEEAGLIHQYTNTPDEFNNLLCNCCQCHCMIMRGVKRSPVPSQAVNARYLIKIDDDACTACEACIERCQMEALKMENGKLVRDEKRCIGCGICMYVCPTDALILKPREAAKVPLKKC